MGYSAMGLYRVRDYSHVMENNVICDARQKTEASVHVHLVGVVHEAGVVDHMVLTFPFLVWPSVQMKCLCMMGEIICHSCCNKTHPHSMTNYTDSNHRGRQRSQGLIQHLMKYLQHATFPVKRSKLKVTMDIWLFSHPLWLRLCLFMDSLHILVQTQPMRSQYVAHHFQVKGQVITSQLTNRRLNIVTEYYRKGRRNTTRLTHWRLYMIRECAVLDQGFTRLRTRPGQDSEWKISKSAWFGNLSAYS